MLRPIAVALAVLAATAPAMAIVAAPTCKSDDASGFPMPQMLAGGLLLTRGYGNDAYTILLASCVAERGLTIRTPTLELAQTIQAQLVSAVASADTYSFEDLKARFHHGETTADIAPISAALCACLTKDN